MQETDEQLNSGNGMHFGGHQSFQCLLNGLRSQNTLKQGTFSSFWNWQVNLRSLTTWKGHGKSHGKSWNLKGSKVKSTNPVLRAFLESETRFVLLDSKTFYRGRNRRLKMIWDVHEAFWTSFRIWNSIGFHSFTHSIARVLLIVTPHNTQNYKEEEEEKKEQRMFFPHTPSLPFQCVRIGNSYIETPLGTDHYFSGGRGGEIIFCKHLFLTYMSTPIFFFSIVIFLQTIFFHIFLVFFLFELNITIALLNYFSKNLINSAIDSHFQEPITRSEQLSCAGVKAFSRTSLFLQRFWREF